MTLPAFSPATLTSIPASAVWMGVSHYAALGGQGNPQMLSGVLDYALGHFPSPGGIALGVYLEELGSGNAQPDTYNYISQSSRLLAREAFAQERSSGIFDPGLAGLIERNLSRVSGNVSGNETVKRGEAFFGQGELPQGKQALELLGQMQQVRDGGIVDPDPRVSLIGGAFFSVSGDQDVIHVLAPRFDAHTLLQVSQIATYHYMVDVSSKASVEDIVAAMPELAASASSTGRDLVFRLSGELVTEGIDKLRAEARRLQRSGILGESGIDLIMYQNDYPVNLSLVESIALPMAAMAAKKTRRAYQADAINAVKGRLARGLQHNLIVLPTGSGKTFTASELVRDLIAEGRVRRKILILTHREEILKQLQGALGEVVGAENVTAVSSGLGEEDFSGRIVVASINTIANRLRQLDANEYDLVISDEAHHSPAKTWSHVLAYMGIVAEEGAAIANSRIIHLGLTATPIRNDDKPLALTFTPEGIAFNYKIEDAVSDGSILMPRGILVLARELDMLGNLNLSFGDDYGDSELDTILNNPGFRNTVVQAYIEQAKGKKALCFATSVAQARQLADLFNRLGVRAGVVLGSQLQNPEERRNIIEAHKRGELDVIVNFGVLTEGYDDPGIEVIMIARPTKSLGLYLQMIGRGFRLDPSKLDVTDFLVMDFAGVTHSFDAQLDLARAFGAQYDNFNRPDLNPFDARRKLEKGLKGTKDRSDEKAVAEIFPLVETDPAYLEVEILQTMTDPLTRKLIRILQEHYHGDQLAMTFALQMPSTVLSNYLNGIYPKTESEVRRHFAHADIIGLTTDEVVEIWEQSQNWRRIQMILEALPGILAELPAPRQAAGLTEFMTKLRLRLRQTDSLLFTVQSGLAILMERARLGNMNVSVLDQLVQRADPHFSIAWARRLEADVERVMRVEHPEFASDLFVRLQQPGMALAEYIPEGVTNIQKLYEALLVRLYPTGTLEKLTRSITIYTVRRDYETIRPLPINLFLKVLKQTDRGSTVLVWGGHLADALEENGYSCQISHPLRSGDMKTIKRWIRNALYSYEEAVGVAFFELLENIHQDSFALSLRHRQESVTQLYTEDLQTLIRKYWSNPTDPSFRIGLVQLQQKLDRMLMVNVLTPDRLAIFSIRLRLRVMLAGLLEEITISYLRDKMSQLLIADPPTTDDDLLRATGLDEIGTAWRVTIPEDSSLADAITDPQKIKRFLGDLIHQRAYSARSMNEDIATSEQNNLINRVNRLMERHRDGFLHNIQETLNVLRTRLDSLQYFDANKRAGVLVTNMARRLEAEPRKALAWIKYFQQEQIDIGYRSRIREIRESIAYIEALTAVRDLAE